MISSDDVEGLTQSVVPRTTGITGDWVETQVLRPNPRPTESEALGMRHVIDV